MDKGGILQSFTYRTQSTCYIDNNVPFITDLLFLLLLFISKQKLVFFF